MNKREREMIEALKKLKNDFGVFQIKAEFEAEGSRREEMERLKDVTTHVGLPIILKIGGVEAVTDVYTAINLGVEGVIAPMAETAFALSKFLSMIKKYVPEDNVDDIEFAFNLETITAFQNMDAMFSLPNINLLSGITIGRVDLVGSMGLSRDDINVSDEVFNICRVAMEKAKKIGLKTGMGGGISTLAIPPIIKLAEAGLLDKFETRKVVFPASSWKYGEKAIPLAADFELLWLKSKREYYSRIKAEDESRIAMIESRV